MKIQYSQITDHIHTLTASQKGAQQIVGGRHVGSRSRSRISGESTDLLLLVLLVLPGGAAVDLDLPSLMCARWWTVPLSSQYRAAERERCRRWRIEVPAHHACQRPTSQSHKHGSRPCIKCARTSIGRSGEAGEAAANTSDIQMKIAPFPQTFSAC
jgi:hypothetical protein